jgi:hypothetical protein
MGQIRNNWRDGGKRAPPDLRKFIVRKKRLFVSIANLVTCSFLKRKSKLTENRVTPSRWSWRGLMLSSKR